MGCGSKGINTSLVTQRAKSRLTVSYAIALKCEHIQTCKTTSIIKVGTGLGCIPSRLIIS